MLKQKKDISKENNLTANHNSQNIFQIHFHQTVQNVINPQTNTQFFFCYSVN